MQHIVVKYNKWYAYIQTLNMSFEYVYITYLYLHVVSHKNYK